jgi:VanZ family protein
MFKIIFWIYAGLILYLSFIPTTQIVKVSYFDKIEHCVAFVIFTFLLKRSYHIGSKYVIIYAVLFGAFIEFVQYFLPYRSADVADLLADFVGSVFGSKFAVRRE